MERHVTRLKSFLPTLLDLSSKLDGPLPQWVPCVWTDLRLGLFKGHRRFDGWVSLMGWDPQILQVLETFSSPLGVTGEFCFTGKPVMSFRLPWTSDINISSS